MSSQHVLCLSTEALVVAHIKPGFSHDIDRTKLFDPTRAWFAPRGLAEHDPTLKQLIPYVVFSCGKKLAIYRRAGSEKRLEGQWSCGFGGHVTLLDALMDVDAAGLDTRATLERGMARELHEEVQYDTQHAKTFPFGFLYDPTTEVSRVHLGCLYRIELAAPELELRDDEGRELTWIDWDQFLVDDTRTYESWARICQDPWVLVFGERP